MSLSDQRTLFAQGVIIAAAGLGASMGLLAPLAEKAELAEQQLTSARDLASKSEELLREAPIWQKTEASCDNFESWLSDQSRPALDPAALHSRITSIGQHLGIQIDRMEPRELRLASGQAPSDSSAGIKPRSVVGFTLDIAGTYEGIAEFINALQHETGLTKIVNVRMVPYMTNEGEKARAAIETQHFAFTVPSPEQLALMSAEVSQ